MKKGWCNCKNDQWVFNRKTPYINTIKDKYHTVRVDDNGLCFLCANHALSSCPDKPRHHNSIVYDRLISGDSTVSLSNPEGIFAVKKVVDMVNKG